MWFGAISLFPDMFDAIKKYGVIGKAIQKEIIQIALWNPRSFTKDRHQSVDDRPYGGGAGMVMRPEPLEQAISTAKKTALDDAKKKCIDLSCKTIYLSPQGKNITYEKLKELVSYSHLILVAGRYEGIDERIIETQIDEECSVGNFVVSGGELPAMLLIDGLARLLPGTIGHPDAVATDSFSSGLLDFPQYTRPLHYKNISVPSVLLSGDHQAIARWRYKQSLGKTWIKRPELLANRKSSDIETLLLEEFIQEYGDTRKSG